MSIEAHSVWRVSPSAYYHDNRQPGACSTSLVSKSHCTVVARKQIIVKKKEGKFFGGEDGLTQIATSTGAHIYYFKGEHMEETPEGLTDAISEALGRV